MEDLPDYSNEDTKAVLDKYGKFDYKKYDCKYDNSLPVLGPFLFPNKSIYFG